MARRKKQARGFSERKSRPKLVFFVDLHRILGRFWDKNLFFFFFGDHQSSAGKFLWIFAPHLVHLIQTRINFSCPRAPLEFTQNKLLVPPQNLFLPLQSRYAGTGPETYLGIKAWNGIWKKIASMEWKKIASTEYEKIVFHSIPCPAIRSFTVTSYLL